MPKKQALYSRVSTEIQRDKGLSIPKQKEWLEQEALRHHFKHTEHFTDNGYSAKDTNRPAFQRLISAIKDGEIDTVIVYKYDRVARRLKDLILFLDDLDKYGVSFISINERFDTTTALGKAMLNVTGTFAQLERETTVERVTDAMWHKARKGDYCGGQVAYGFDNKDKHLIHNQFEADIIRQMFNRFEDRPSYRGIVLWLNKNCYKTKRGTTFAQSTVRRLLTNSIYKGYQTWGKRPHKAKSLVSSDKWLITKAKVEPIVSEEQFDRVQRIILSRPRIEKTRKYDVTYILDDSVMRCECGATLNGYTYPKKTSKGIKLYPYYVCHNHKSKGSSVCSGNTLPKADIEGEVLREVIEKAKLYFEESETKRVIDSKKADSPTSHLERVEQTLANLKQRKDRLLSLYEDGSIAKDILVKRMDALDLEIDQADDRRQALDDELNPKNKARREDLLQEVNGDLMSMSDPKKKEILRELLKSVTVKRDKTVEIELYDL